MTTTSECALLPISRLGVGLYLALAFLVPREAVTEGEPRLSKGDFQGPRACAKCHPQHYQEWRGSAHAYSTRDPIFQALHERARKETNGKIGAFCVRCHTPVAARTGEFSETFDVDSVSLVAQHGVSCEVCHKMEPPPEGMPIANASFEMAAGNVVYGRFHGPVATSAHETVTSDFLGKSEMCGACHDVMHSGVLLEKSFAEWSGSVHRERADRCQDCHMRLYSGQAAVDGPFREALHRHNFPAVSLPLIPFPNRGLQTEQIRELLGSAVRMSVLAPRVVQAGGDLVVEVRVKNSGTGHNIPSGLSNKRQMWIEVTVSDAEGNRVFQSGHLDSNGDLMDSHSELHPGADRHLTSFSDRFLDEKGEEVAFVWQASGLEQHSLKPLEERVATYTVPIPASLDGSRVRVRVRLLFRSFPPHTLRDLGLAHLVESLPIWEMNAFESGPLSVLRELPRKTRYRVPQDFSTLGEAMEALRDGDTILIEPGEYSLRESIDFRGKSIHVRSIAGAKKTLLRFQGSPETVDASVVVFRRGEGRGAKLEGLTLTGGKGTMTRGVRGEARKGGGIYIEGASPTIVDCIVRESSASGGSGGGICIEGGSPQVIDSVIESCRAERGGGLSFLPGARPHLGEKNLVVFRGNKVRTNEAGSGGGFYFAPGTEALVERSEVAANSSSGSGGGFFVADGASVRLDHTTVVFNTSQSGPGALATPGSKRVLVSNSILWSNEPPGGAASFSYCILDHEELTPSNWKEFPLFRDPTGFLDPITGRWALGDYRVFLNSPAVDAGDPAAPLDPDDSRTDIGATLFLQPLRAFVRGDVTGDGAVMAEDLGLLLQYLLVGAEVRCLDAADVDDDGQVAPLDVLTLTVYLLMGTTPPRPPFPACGPDPTFGEGLSCHRKAEPCRGTQP